MLLVDQLQALLMLLLTVWKNLVDEIGNTFVETLTLHPGRGMASAGNSIVTVGKGIYDTAKSLYQVHLGYYMN